ncbi:MAG: group II intron reverse transcriptase/maturase [Phormidesmis sp.]
MSSNANVMNTGNRSMYEWSSIDWHKLERNAYKLQKRIYRASERGDVKLVRRLQRLLTKSWAAKAISVRRVSQDNRGKKTAGVDGVKSLTPKQRLSLVDELYLGTKASSNRRVWIPKPGTEEKRPLVIPTMKDRALQALVKMALEPEWEAQFEPNSYGFRPGRSCHDAIAAIQQTIQRKPKFVLDADISKCFDRINHQKLLEKLNTYPTLRRQIRAWLKAGVMDGKTLFPTNEGTPQGGVISPLLANIALHGMEEHIKSLARQFDMPRANGNQQSITVKRQSVAVIRYADDFVIFHKDIEVIKRCKAEIEEWLADMDLALKPSKTRLTHTLNAYNDEAPGFDSLGFHVRQFSTGKHSSGRGSHGLLGFKTKFSPSKKSLKAHYRKIATIFEASYGSRQEVLIRRLNPVIRGWSNYFSVCTRTYFPKMDHQIIWKAMRWGKHRHVRKTVDWIVNKYFHTIKNSKWNFSAFKDGKPVAVLLKHSATRFRRYVKVKGRSSPYDGNLVYWSTRMGRHPELTSRIARFLKQQKGKCVHCGLYFKNTDVWDIDHIVPKALGGKNEASNLQLIHRHCHHQKTVLDGSRRAGESSRTTEEPCEVKVSSTVL